MPDPLRKTSFLNLLSELSIVEDLVFKRLETRLPPELSDGLFGVLNRFVRNGISSEPFSTTSYALRDEEERTLEKVTRLIAAGLITRAPIEGRDDDWMLTITPAGKLAHKDAISAFSPEVEPLFEGIETESIEAAIAVLRELRRTLDNLPDR